VAVAVYKFGDFVLDCGRFELRRDGRSIKLERKPLELLIFLAESNSRLVTRTEISDRLWEREVFVDTEHGINTAIRKIRQALDDDSETPIFVQTVTGMGYRFVAPVSQVDTGFNREVTISSPKEAEPVESRPEIEEARPIASSRRKLWLPLLQRQPQPYSSPAYLSGLIRSPPACFTATLLPPSDPSPFFPSTISPVIPTRSILPTA
jgi:DNA-binding winged helix-turn-helix (wHTH) protein